MTNKRIQVTENGWCWNGTVLYEEKGFGKDVWYVVRPDDVGLVLTRRGGSSTEWASELVKIPSFANPKFLVTRRNLMSGKSFEEPEDTPWCCSPASETFWSN